MSLLGVSHIPVVVRYTENRRRAVIALATTLELWFCLCPFKCAMVAGAREDLPHMALVLMQEDDDDDGGDDDDDGGGGGGDDDDDDVWWV